MYRYGMRLRGFSLGCQPMKGIVERADDTTGKYHDIIVYSRKLTEEELSDYELDYLGCDEENERYWFAILMDEEDNDWGDGSFDFEEAREKAKSLGAWGIARINDNHDPLCEQIYEADEWDNTDGFN